ncbi:bifunctional oligoribonuclease/PAP phosphatase NrnA [Candidatus Margulisiibacteriota bacterium]
MNIEQKIINELLKAKQVLCICHLDPDGDTIWSAIALKELLRQKKVKVKVACGDPVPENLKIFPGVDKVSTKIHEGWSNGLVVALEAGDVKRLGFSIKVDINIDHHFDNTKYGKINWIDAKASALASMIYKMSRSAKFKITPVIASLLYAAISSDTGGFRFGNTTRQTFADANELVRCGAQPDKIYHLVYENVSARALQKLGQALKELKVIEKGKIVYSAVKKVDAETGHGIIDVIRTIRGTEIAILFKELGAKRVKVSLRSKNNFNVQAVAKKFNGGGHKKAAGCELNLSLAEAKNKVLKEITKRLRD